MKTIEEMEQWLEQTNQSPMTVLIERLIRRDDKNGLLLLGTCIKSSEDTSAKNIYEMITKKTL